MRLRNPFRKAELPEAKSAPNFGESFTRTDGIQFLTPTWSNTAGYRGPMYYNSAVMGCLAWIMDTIPEAKLRVWQTKGDEEEQLPTHRLYDLIRNPNVSSGYMWSDLLGAIGCSLGMDGNAYVRLVFNQSNAQVSSLEFVPTTRCEPYEQLQGAGLTGYRITTKRGESIIVPREHVIHFRQGIDPENDLKGLSRFKAIVKSVLTDNEAEVYNHTVLKNLGIMGYVISQDSSDEVLTEDQARAIEERILQGFTGEDRGKPAVLGGQYKIQSVGNSPDQMSVRDMRITPEERICSIFRLPPMVIGLGAGLERSTNSNMDAARKMATESCNAPMWQRLAETLDSQLGPFIGLQPGQYLAFDTSKVKALQEEETAKHKRACDNFKNGIWKRSESRAYTGKQSDGTDDVYFTDVQASQALANATAGAQADSASRAKLFQTLDAADN